jgi:hypothetical protein
VPDSAKPRSRGYVGQAGVLECWLVPPPAQQIIRSHCELQCSNLVGRTCLGADTRAEAGLPRRGVHRNDVRIGWSDSCKA